MNARRLSNYVTPLLWLIGIPLPVLIPFLSRESFTDGSFLNACIGAVVTGAMGIGVSWCLLTLKIVWTDENGLRVRGIFKRYTVRYSNIVKVRGNRWSGLISATVVFPWVTVTVRVPDRPPRQIRFLPVYTLDWPNGVHRDVAFLRERAAEMQEISG